MTPTEGLVKKAAALSRAAPREWAQFVEEFDAYSEIVRGQCIQAPLEDLQRAQGRAQHATAVCKFLENAVSTADRIAEKARK